MNKHSFYWTALLISVALIISLLVLGYRGAELPVGIRLIIGSWIGFLAYGLSYLIHHR